MLKQLREAAGLSQSQLAEASGVSIHAIHKYEREARDVSTASAMTVYKLATALGVRMETVMGVQPLD